MAGFNSVACGVSACYAISAGAGTYRNAHRIANTGATLEDISAGLTAATVGGLVVDGADGLYVVQNTIGVLLRAATASSFVAVGNKLSNVYVDRRSLARDGNGTLFVTVFPAVSALPSGGSTFAPVGTGLAGAVAVATDGTNLFVSYDVVKMLPGSTGTWIDAGSNSPKTVTDLVFDRLGRLYATSTGVEPDTGIQRLAAGGNTWEDMTTGLVRSAFNMKMISDLVFDSQNTGYIIAKGDGLTAANVLMKRGAGDTRWTPISSAGIPDGFAFCRGLAMDALRRFVAACSTGLFRSSPLP